MKNFKLLLATTAFLSTGAILANADDLIPSSTTLNVHIGLVMVDEIVPIQDIDFGAFRVTAESLENQLFSKTMYAKDGWIPSNSDEIIGESKNGQVSVTMSNNSLKTIQLENKVVLRDYSGNQLEFEPNFEEINSFDNGYGYTRKIFGIGGTITGNKGRFRYGQGEYTGKLTVTVIADTGE